MSKLITFKTAVLAKEKGFDLEVYSYYTEKARLFKTLEPTYDDGTRMPQGHMVSSMNYNEEDNNTFSAPTQAELQTWLLDNYGLFVNVDLAYNKWGKFAGSVQKLSKDKETAIIALDGFSIFDNQFNAMEEGLYEALKLIS